MANTFKSEVTEDIGTSAATIYTAPASTTSIVIGLSLANIIATNITASVELVKNDSASTAVMIVKDAPVAVGGSLLVIGGNQKLVLQTGDFLRVTSSDNVSIDAVVSMMEQT